MGAIAEAFETKYALLLLSLQEEAPDKVRRQLNLCLIL